MLQTVHLGLSLLNIYEHEASIATALNLLSLPYQGRSSRDQVCIHRCTISRASRLNAAI